MKTIIEKMVVNIVKQFNCSVTVITVYNWVYMSLATLIATLSATLTKTDFMAFYLV